LCPTGPFLAKELVYNERNGIRLFTGGTSGTPDPQILVPDTLYQFRQRLVPEIKKVGSLTHEKSVICRDLVNKLSDSFPRIVRHNMFEIFRETAYPILQKQTMQPSFNHGAFFFFQMNAIVRFYVGCKLMEFLIGH